jgi:transcriptional regulatory protein LevR
VFRDEFSSLLEQIALTNEKLLIVGDFNLSIRDQPDDAAQRLLDSTEAFGLSQLVTSATHEGG